MTRNPS